jgi:membrane associated rhomboid family serine protease
MHGGFMHILFNMWFLHIFGDNVEDKLGHIPYLLFYLFGGFVATMGQYFFDTNSTIPLVGASGAISAVAGAYFVFYRDSKVKTFIPAVIIPVIIDIPAWFFLGYWFVIQVFSGIGSLTESINEGGVAFFAHVSGFVFGYFLARTLRPKTETAATTEIGEVVTS